MISTRNGIWETNSSSIHVLAIAKNPEHELEFPRRLIVRLSTISIYDEEYDDKNMQCRLDTIIKLILSGGPKTQVIYHLFGFIRFLKWRASVEFEWDYNSFNTWDYDYNSFYDEELVDSLFKRDDIFHIFYQYLINYKSFLIDYDNNYPEKIDELKNDRDFRDIFTVSD